MQQFSNLVFGSMLFSEVILGVIFPLYFFVSRVLGNLLDVKMTGWACKFGSSRFVESGFSLLLWVLI